MSNENLSLYKENILDFIHLAETMPELFTQDDWVDFDKLVTSLKHEIETEKISNEIALWCEQHPAILKVFLELPVSDKHRGPGGQKSQFTPEVFQEMLENVVRAGQPETSSQPPPQKPEKTPDDRPS